MAIRVLPTFSGIYHFRYSVELDGDGRLFTLGYHFNPRDLTAGTDGAWYLDLLDARGQPLVMGKKLALGSNLWKRHRNRAGMPKGRLEVVDVTGAGLEASRLDLGVRVLVRYDAEDTA